MNKRHADIAAGIILCLIAWFLNGQLAGIPREGTLLPKAILLLLAGSGLLIALTGLLRKQECTLQILADLNARHFVAVVSIFMVSVYACLYVSYLTTLFLMCLTVTTVLSGKRSGKTIVGNCVFSASIVVFIYLFFTKLMHVYFPEPIFS